MARHFRLSVALISVVAGSLLAGMAAALPAAAHTSILFADTYKLRVVNDSGSKTDFAVYQVDPGFSAAAVPLVWQDVPLNANAETGLSWNLDYSFSLSNSVDLKPGALYRPVQTLSVSPGAPREDRADLTDSHGVLGMHRSPSMQSDGTLSLYTAKAIPTGDGSMALGMAGRPASVLKVEPNQTLTFSPHPSYWITAGTFIEGEVINPRTVSDALHLNFGRDGLITVTLHLGGRWTVS